MHLQMFVFVLMGVCFQIEAATVRNETTTRRISLNRSLNQNKWFGPEYRPRWYDPSTVTTRSGDTHFGYEPPHGSDTWPDSFPECGGDRQSPINLQSRDLDNRLARTPLKFNNYELTPDTVRLENSGHSMHITADFSDANRQPYISGGPAGENEKYVLSQIHWHWAEVNSRGSEHTINHKRFPSEMHVVHSLQGDDTAADPFDEDPDNILVVGYMIDIQDRDNSAFAPILEACRRIRSPGQKTELRPFPISRMLREFDSNYVTYEGSLTTPPCSETVKWVVSSMPIRISTRQMDSLRTCIRDEEGKVLRFNYRGTQDIKDRSVYYLTN